MLFSVRSIGSQFSYRREPGLYCGETYRPKWKRKRTRTLRIHTALISLHMLITDWRDPSSMHWDYERCLQWSQLNLPVRAETKMRLTRAQPRRTTPTQTSISVRQIAQNTVGGFIVEGGTEGGRWSREGHQRERDDFPMSCCGTYCCNPLLWDILLQSISLPPVPWLLDSKINHRVRMLINMCPPPDHLIRRRALQQRKLPWERGQVAHHGQSRWSEIQLSTVLSENASQWSAPLTFHVVCGPGTPINPCSRWPSEEYLW